MPTDTRSAVAEVIQKLSTEASDATSSDQPSGSDVGDGGGSATAADASASSEVAAGAESAVGETRSAAERARDPQGRFAKAEKERKEAAAAAQVDPVAPAEAVKPAVDPALPKLNPPQNWRAAAKEKFKDSPREVQEEALRVHAEVQKTLQRSAELEKEAGGWKEAIAPYEHIFQRNGIPAAQAVSSLLRSFATLESGPTPARMQVAADIIRNYIGTDEAALTQLGQLLQAGGAAQPREQPQALSPEQIRQLAREEWQSAQHQQSRDTVVKTWLDFEASKPEFLEEPGLRRAITVLAASWQAEHPGQSPGAADFKALYDEACGLIPGAARVINQRKEAAAVKAKQASTQGAAAASGLKNEPAGPSNGAGPAKDTREEVARLMKKARQARV